VKRPITSNRLIEHKSDEEDVFGLVNALMDQAVLTPVFRVRGETLGAGAYVRLWSDVVPTGAAIHLKASVAGVGTGNTAWYEILAGVKNVAGVLTVVGAQDVTAGEDAAACDARFGVTGTTVYLEVRDDAVNTMRWSANVTYLATG
jgi:hypothetical protein